ncbi:hypothetical protein O3G_MSEX006181 [Manduca sexta]|nr:hypothetical protein O3G_MSEX006181 [Manduca sexta]
MGAGRRPTSAAAACRLPPPSVAPQAPEGLHVSSHPPRDLCNHPR